MEMVYVWAAILVLAVIAEALTTSLVAIWFLPGAVLALIFSLLSFPEWVQIIAFLIPSLGLIFRIVFREKFFHNKVIATNVDALIGQKAAVVERIDNLAGSGAARADNKVWTARSVDDAITMDPGEIVEITAIEGVKLICKKNN